MMNQFLDDIELVITSNFTINHIERTLYDYFVAEDYPALCEEPSGESPELQGLSNVMGGGVLVANVYYVEKYDANRDITTFIQTVDNMVKLLVEDVNLNSTYENMKVDVSYLKADKRDNNEFKARISIKAKK